MDPGGLGEGGRAPGRRGCRRGRSRSARVLPILRKVRRFIGASCGPAGSKPHPERKLRPRIRSKWRPVKGSRGLRVAADFACKRPEAAAVCPGRARDRGLGLIPRSSEKETDDEQADDLDGGGRVRDRRGGRALRVARERPGEVSSRMRAISVATSGRTRGTSGATSRTSSRTPRTSGRTAPRCGARASSCATLTSRAIPTQSRPRARISRRRAAACAATSRTAAAISAICTGIGRTGARTSRISTRTSRTGARTSATCAGIGATCIGISRLAGRAGRKSSRRGSGSSPFPGAPVTAPHCVGGADHLGY